MNQILIHVAGVVIGAIIVSLLRLNTKRVVVSCATPISWVWKAMALTGKLAFYYGLIVFLSNLFILGAQAPNTGVGASIMSFGLIFWIWGGLVIYFKRN
jgi:hypothetical protein